MQGRLEGIRFDIKKTKQEGDYGFYKISIKVPMEIGWIEGMNFVAGGDGFCQTVQLKHAKNENGMVYFEGEAKLVTQAIYHYHFSFEVNGTTVYFKKGNDEHLDRIYDDEKWQMPVNFEVPEWAKDKIMYHVFVDRFCRGSKSLPPEMPRRTVHQSWDEPPLVGPDKNGIWNADFYGGDLKGIEQKLDYIKSLGTGILYLSPVVRSQSNHRYDTGDYEQVDPYAGTNEDLKSLCDKAHKKGMKVILDAVFNHTGNDSKYFNEFGTYPEKGAFQGKDSKYYYYYRKSFGDKDYFHYWWGMPNLPECDCNNPDWQNFIYGENGVIDQWFKLGIDGLRLDVADELSKEFLEGIRRAVKRNKEDGFILGEVWENPMRMNRSYISSGKEMDSVMNYVLVDALIRYFKYGDVSKLAEIFRQLRTEYPKETMHSLMNFTSTHDISRAINIFGSYDFDGYRKWAWDLRRDIDDDREKQKNYHLSEAQYAFGKKLYESYIFTLAFMPGNLSIFYGDEIGMQGMGNLANRAPFNWNGGDKELLAFFRRIGEIRNKEKFLTQADLHLRDINDRYVQFERETPNEQALVTVSRSHEPTKLIVPGDFEYADSLYKLGESNREELSPYGGLVLKKKKR